MGYRLLQGSMAFAVFLAITAVAMLGPLLVDMADALSVSIPVAEQVVTMVLGSGFLMAFSVNGKAVERARERYAKYPDDDST